QATFEAISADTQLLYASDWPHWDFDAPSSITKLPFLNEQAKRNILGLSAARLFELEVPPAKSGKKAPPQRVGEWHELITDFGRRCRRGVLRVGRRRVQARHAGGGVGREPAACAVGRGQTLCRQDRGPRPRARALRRQAGERDRGRHRHLRDHACGRPQLLRPADVVPPRPKGLMRTLTMTGVKR